MSATPRTDANECEAIDRLGRCVGANFARRLERENAVLRQAILKALPILDDYEVSRFHGGAKAAELLRDALTTTA